VVTGVGEPWTFGLRPEALPAYLEERGLRLVKDMSANEYRTHTMGAAAASASAASRARIIARQHRRGTVRTGSKLLYPSS